MTVASFADGKGFGVNFFDIGRMDAILIRCDGVTAFIDVDFKWDAKPGLVYLKGMSVDKLDYYIGSHAQANHVASDRFLMDFAGTLRKNFREPELLYRIGGD